MEPLTINELIRHVESRNRPSAMRFEPAVYQRITTGPLTQAEMSILGRIKEQNRCSDGTARMIYSTSWGLYQIMGFNLYTTDGISGPITEYSAASSVQDATFLQFLKRNGLQDFTPGKLAEDAALRLKFSMKYNGAIAYADALVAALAHFGITAK